jgi:ABC-type nitrate/sulfonate/bicarbonate transport system substrate-binding protein
MLAASAQGGIFSIEAMPGVNSITDLKGKTAAVTSAGSTTDLLLRQVLQQNKLVPTQDVGVTVIADNALQASVESSAKVIAPDMNIPMDYLANSLKIAAANVPEVATLKPEDLVDVSLLQEIKASGFIDKLYQS